MKTGSVTYTGRLENLTQNDYGFEWPYHAYIYENDLIAGHGLGHSPEEAYKDAWEQFWLTPPETEVCQLCGRANCPLRPHSLP